MKRVRIYKPAKSSMQSGVKNTLKWILEFIDDENEESDARFIEPLMGWTGTRSNLSQMRLYFKDKQSAVSYAKQNGFYSILEDEKQRKVIPKSYSDNFRYNKPISS